jgi:hypothetical protein
VHSAGPKTAGDVFLASITSRSRSSREGGEGHYTPKGHRGTRLERQDGGERGEVGVEEGEEEFGVREIGV